MTQSALDAIDNPKPKLTHSVGKDAVEFIEARRKLPEQELSNSRAKYLEKEEDDYYTTLGSNFSVL